MPFYKMKRRDGIKAAELIKLLSEAHPDSVVIWRPGFNYVRTAELDALPPISHGSAPCVYLE